jgi:hypothetical protein
VPILRSALIAACLAVGALTLPTVASATPSTLYVSNNAPSAPFNSCAHPNYSHVQEAVNQPTSTVKVCSGTYTEQVQIEKGIAIVGEPGAVLKLPVAPADSTTPCDTAIPAKYEPNQDEISICTGGVVSISGLKIEALWPAGYCYDSMYGIFIAGGATLKATGDTIDGAGASPINGCQGGVALQAGSARTEPNEVGHAILDNVSISGYQKNGINITGAGATGVITKTTVTGAGPTDQIAQNGLEVAFGGVAKVKSSTISGNECEDVPACGFTGTQSAGILFFLDGTGSSVTKSKIDENDFGAYYVSESPTEPASPEVSFTKDTLSGNRYEGLILDQGNAQLTHDKIKGPGKIGIELVQYEGQTLEPNSRASKVKFSGLSEADLKVSSDKQPGDLPGKFTITKSTVKVVISESSNYELVF